MKEIIKDLEDEIGAFDIAMRGRGYEFSNDDKNILTLSVNQAKQIVEALKNTRVLVIEEFDPIYEETDIIGVADSVDKAAALINKYYGDYKELSLHDLDMPNVEYRKVIEVDGETKWVTLHWFTLNVDEAL